jgi:hypothetical protein
MIDPESLEVGQCYLTRSGQVRRVRAFHEGGKSSPQPAVFRFPGARRRSRHA